VIPPDSQIPSSPVGDIQSGSPYYLVYDYQHFITMWNVALKQAHQVLYDIDAIPAPYFYYDPPTQLISLYTPVQYDASNTSICFNNQLLQYFVGLYTMNLNQGGQDKANGIDNIIITHYVANNLVSLPTNPPPTDSTPNFCKSSFQYNSYGYWNWLKSILITTTMNVNSEMVFDNNNSKNNYQNVNFVNILEDFMPDLAIPNGAGIQNQIFTYFAQSLYRVFSFNQKNPLYKVDLNLSVVDTYGNTYPLTLPKGQLANFKMMFIKKSVYATMNKSLK
jgi:hypothetical protein